MHRKKIFAVVVSAFIILASVILVTTGTPSRSYTGYIESLGWQTDEKSVSVSDIVIPAQWDETMEQYNDLQKKSGYDLTDYKGKTAKLYSYAVLNFEGYDKPVFINLIVYNGEIIGGDISSVAIDGFMIPLSKEKEKDEYMNGTA